MCYKYAVAELSDGSRRFVCVAGGNPWYESVNKILLKITTAVLQVFYHTVEHNTLQ